MVEVYTEEQVRLRSNLKIYVNQQEVALSCVAGPPAGGRTENNGSKLPQMGDTEAMLLLLHKTPYIFAICVLND